MDAYRAMFRLRMNVSIFFFTSFCFTSSAFEQVNEVVLEDFRDIVTMVDFGFNDFSGNVGATNKKTGTYGAVELVCPDQAKPAADACALRFTWDFTVGNDEEAFTGVFFSLFGLTDTKATFDHQTVDKIEFPEHSLDLDAIDAPLIEPGGPRSLLNLNFAFRYTAGETLKLKVELKDTNGNSRFARFPISNSLQQQSVSWDFRDPNAYTEAGTFDVHHAKVLTFVIERKHVSDGVTNPDTGQIDFKRIWFTPDRPEVEPASDEELLDLLERRCAQYFLDWSSRKKADWESINEDKGVVQHPGSFGLPQDRSTFNDLLTIGGVGFQIPACIISAERGWITRAEAVERVLSVLKLLANESSFGPERVGRIGHKGWFYHFLGLDGLRKQNFDFPDSELKEHLNTVELSTIDTGLALMGVLAAQSYFKRDNPNETEIYTRAQAIYDRVEWDFMLESTSNQFYLGWKPDEKRRGDNFEIRDENHEGSYSNKSDGSPLTLDFYTDEAAIVTLLAIGSTTHPVDSDVHCAWIRCIDDRFLVRTYPGSLFTYQFLHAFLDTQRVNLTVCSDDPDSWYENSRKAIRATLRYAQENPKGYSTYGRNAWGLSACEGPDDRYLAFGAPTVALRRCDLDPLCPVEDGTCSDESGTVAYYPMVSAVAFGDDLRARASDSVRSGWKRKHWHQRFALPDAFNEAISEADLDTGEGNDNTLLRDSGSWVQRALFAIDQGPMLLHLENQRSGLIWKLLRKNPNIRRALSRLHNEL